MLQDNRLNDPENTFTIVEYGTNAGTNIPYVIIEVQPGLDANNKPRIRYDGIDKIPGKVLKAIDKLEKEKHPVEVKELKAAPPSIDDISLGV